MIKYNKILLVLCFWKDLPADQIGESDVVLEC